MIYEVAAVLYSRQSFHPAPTKGPNPALTSSDLRFGGLSSCGPGIVFQLKNMFKWMLKRRTLNGLTPQTSMKYTGHLTYTFKGPETSAQPPKSWSAGWSSKWRKHICPRCPGTHGNAPSHQRMPQKPICLQFRLNDSVGIESWGTWHMYVWTKLRYFRIHINK